MLTKISSFIITVTIMIIVYVLLNNYCLSSLIASARITKNKIEKMVYNTINVFRHNLFYPPIHIPSQIQ